MKRAILGWVGVCLALGAMGGSAQAFTVARNGKAKCAIVLAADAIAAERTAAKELAEHLRLVTGATFAIRQEAGEAETAILLGPSPQARQLLPDVKWDTLGHDGIVIRTTGNRLVLAGGRPRGTLYAVYTFLEDTVGVRWWTDAERFIPRRRTLEVGELNTVYVPKLRYRETFHSHVLDKNHVAAARFRLNGHFSRIPEEWGGHYDILGWCHTSYALLNPGEYFAKHPDWYSMHGGKRTADGGQMCWTNEEMQREMARRALEWARKNPAAGIVSISQNDWYGPCECARCKALDDANGGAHAASLITGINAIAEIITKEYPDFLVETLAYQYSRKPPTQVRPSAHVLVRLCSIECDFSHPLAGEQNKGFGDDLRGWSKVAANLFVWNYVTNFASYLIPHPNLTPTAEDLRFFVGHNVVGVFEQADSANQLAGDMLPLRCWLQAHLLWDPSRDQDALVREFLDGYYSGAGRYLHEYLQVVNAPARDPKFRRGCYHTDVAFLTPQAVARCVELFDAAEKAVAGHQQLLSRVRRERLALEHVLLLRYDFRKEIAARTKGRLAPEAAADAVFRDYEKQAGDFSRRATKSGVRNYSEGLGFPAYLPSLNLRYAKFLQPKLPRAGEPMPAGVVDVQEDRFELHGKGNWSELVDDPKASNGRAARMPGGHAEWAVQFTIPKDAREFGKGRWKCYVVVRVKYKEPTSAAFTYGLYNTKNGAYGAMEHIGRDMAGDEEYHAYALLADELQTGMSFWVNPPGQAAVEAVYVDRIYCVREKRPR